jgi:hypothetical protein
MRKIYPPPFNKFTVFVLYGLLSIIATITLAQRPKSDVLFNANCLPQLMAAPKLMIGYIQLSMIGSQSIPWDYLDYINVIGKK